MILLCLSKVIVGFIPFRFWRDYLGSNAGRIDSNTARRMANVVNRADERLPFQTKCLPRAMALSWSLRRQRLRHAVVFAVRPADRRETEEALHAWVEVADQRILGDLPGPWIETLRLPRSLKR